MGVTGFLASELPHSASVKKINRNEIKFYLNLLKNFYNNYCKIEMFGV